MAGAGRISKESCPTQKVGENMDRPVLLVALRGRRVILPLSAGLLVFIADALVTFAASVTNT